MASCPAWRRKGRCLEITWENICFPWFVQGLAGSISHVLGKPGLARPEEGTSGPEAMVGCVVSSSICINQHPKAQWIQLCYQQITWGPRPIPKDKQYQGQTGKGSEDLERYKMMRKAGFKIYIKYDINSIRESESAGRSVTQPPIARRPLSFIVHLHWPIRIH